MPGPRGVSAQGAWSGGVVSQHVRGGLPQCMLGYHPPPIPPGAGTTPQSRHPPGTRNPQSRHPPSRQAPPQSRHPPPPRCRACWELRSTRGRYTSYWNAILFSFKIYICINFCGVYQWWIYMVKFWTRVPLLWLIHTARDRDRERDRDRDREGYNRKQWLPVPVPV